MSKATKILLGIWTLFPIFYFIFFFIAIFGFVFSAENMASSSGPPRMFLASFGFIFVLHFIAILSILALQVFYIIDAVKRFKGDQNNLLIWVLVLALIGVVGPIAYYFVVLVKLPELPPDNNEQDLSNNLWAADQERL